MTRRYSAVSLGTPRFDGLAAQGLPDLLTVEEAAALLRIGRNQAYDLTRQWRTTNGQSGLPVVEFGPHTLRVPRHALEQLVGAELTGPLPAGRRLRVVPGESGPSPTAEAPRLGPAGDDEATDPTAGAVRANITPFRRPRRSATSDQLSLFEPPDPRTPQRP